MRKIVLASVLKPVDDTRVYEKFGKSLAKLEDTEVIIFGTQSNDASLYKLEKNVRFEPYDINEKSTRSNVGRLFHALLKKEQPESVIIHTIELLPFLVWYKITNKNAGIYYDILENYPLNFTAQSYYSNTFKYLLAFGANAIEKLSFPFIDYIFSAEKTYLEEKSLPKDKTIVLENKYVPILPKIEKVKSETVHIIFCGTLSKAFGVMEFLNFVANIGSCKSQLNIKFKIIGKAYEEDVIKRIEKYAEKYSIETVGITAFVPHLTIIKAMQEADFVALPYPSNPSTQHCIPTKMYECMAMGIPMLIQNNPFWERITTPYQAGVFMDFNSCNIQELIDRIKVFEAYKNGINKNALWKTEEQKLLNIYSRKNNQ
ncbi:glycosyltransferase [Flammeovirga aprica]|uniref:Glycosyltransferase family 4 protein n=1 Tax=Flammeovirga aprica JL-4 TaxID=694437 RepID=A0A7X9XAM9_9BACT|nr:glycosyltransferase [Flammeovirga aprica]NME69837.1 glycosyltransferase family 4 protein [Flammeovirga aprica JL-4]